MAKIENTNLLSPCWILGSYFQDSFAFYPCSLLFTLNRSLQYPHAEKYCVDLHLIAGIKRLSHEYCAYTINIFFSQSVLTVRRWLRNASSCGVSSVYNTCRLRTAASAVSACESRSTARCSAKSARAWGVSTISQGPLTVMDARGKLDGKTYSVIFIRW